LLSRFFGKGHSLNKNFPLKENKTLSAINNKFDRVSLSIGMSIRESKDQSLSKNTKLTWSFAKTLDLRSDSVQLLYFLDYEKNPKEYYRLSIENGADETIGGKSSLRSFSGYRSAKELCGEKVYASTQLGNDQLLKTPRMKVVHIRFKDNNGKEYYVNFNERDVVRHSNKAIIERNPELAIPSEYYVSYDVGEINCLSF
jgi:hypothetical protein